MTVKGGRLRVLFIRGGGTKTLKYRLTFDARGYYQIGPTFVETGDVFGLHRRHRVLTDPVFVLVYPKVLPIANVSSSSANL